MGLKLVLDSLALGRIGGMSIEGILVAFRVDLSGMIAIGSLGSLVVASDLLLRNAMSLFRLLNFLDGLIFLYWDIVWITVQLTGEKIRLSKLSRSSKLVLGRA